MKKRYLPFGYAVRDGNIVVDTEQRTIVQNIFTAYLAGNTFQQIAKSMISKGIEYHQNDAEWNKNTISRILGNETYCGTDRYPPIVTKEIFRQAAQVRSAKASAYSAALAPFRKDIQCGCCGERLYWHGKTNQWHCRQCRMWSAPIEEVVLSEEIIQRLKWLQENSLQIRAPDTHSVVRSMDSARLDREIQRKIATDKFDEDDLVAAILHRAELEYEFCSAGDADPATMQIRKACAEYKPTDGFHIPFIRRSSARSSCTVTPILNSNCGTDKLCKGKSHEQHENH